MTKNEELDYLLTILPGSHRGIRYNDKSWTTTGTFAEREPIETDIIIQISINGKENNLIFSWNENTQRWYLSENG